MHICQHGVTYTYDMYSHVHNYKHTYLFLQPFHKHVADGTQQNTIQYYTTRTQ